MYQHRILGNVSQFNSFIPPPRVACSEQCSHSANQEPGLFIQYLQTETQSHTIRSPWYEKNLYIVIIVHTAYLINQSEWETKKDISHFYT